MINPWLGISLVLVMLIGLIGGLRWYKRKFSPHPELVRKLLHVSMGLTALSFPWLFADAWPVVLLAAVTIPALYAFRQFKNLKSHLGGVIDGVGRAESLGEIYFPLGVAALFVLSGGDPLLYSIPLLLLTLADAVAALVGLRYGLTQYTTLEGEKTAEGSGAFFIVAFFSSHIPLLLFSQTGRAETLLIALILGFLMMLVEAVAWQGLDNLFIPVIGFILLNTFLGMTVAELTTRLVITVALTIFTLVWRRQANLNDSALLGAALIGYLSWTLGDWRWFLGSFIVFAGHIVLSSGYDWRDLGLGRCKKLASLVLRRGRSKLSYKLSRSQEEAALNQPSENGRSIQPCYTIHAVLSVGFGGLLWLFLFRILDRPELFYPFMLALAAQLAIMIIIARKHTNPNRSASSLLGASVIGGWLCLFVPFVLLEGFTVPTIIYTLAAPFGVLLAGLTFYHTQPIVEHYPTDRMRWLRQAACAALGSVVGLIPLYLI